MNGSTTIGHFHLSLFLLIGLLCCCITMVMLGTTTTLWNDQDPTDPFMGSVLEGFSLPSLGTVFSVSLPRASCSPSPPVDHGILLARSLFHPPYSYV
jgi:hypothetical protein